MGIIDSAIDALRFKDTIFYKEDSDLQDKYEALQKLNIEYPNNEDILNELFMVKKGLDGENEIAYQLKKAHIGMYVLRDIKLQYQDLKAQIDYVIITPVYTYFVESVNEKGDFIREYTVNGKKIKKGMYSPLRQVEAQREVVRKIWESTTSKFIKVLASKNFEYYRRVLVVAANQDTILNTSKAPKEIKYKVLRADALIRQIEYDLNHGREGDVFDNKKSMEAAAQSYLNSSIKENIDFYEYYKNKFCNNAKEIVNDNLKERLINLRKVRAAEKKIPPYYVFNNDELDRIVELRPKTIEELKRSNILTSVKINSHGKAIIDEINK